MLGKKVWVVSRSFLGIYPAVKIGKHLLEVNDNGKLVTREYPSPLRDVFEFMEVYGKIFDSRSKAIEYCMTKLVRRYPDLVIVAIRDNRFGNKDADECLAVLVDLVSQQMTAKCLAKQEKTGAERGRATRERVAKFANNNSYPVSDADMHKICNP